MQIGEMLLFFMSRLVKYSSISNYLIVCENNFSKMKFWRKVKGGLVNLLNSYSAVANGFRLAKDYEKAKIAFEKASKGQEMLSSYPFII